MRSRLNFQHVCAWFLYIVRSERWLPDFCRWHSRWFAKMGQRFRFKYLIGIWSELFANCKSYPIDSSLSTTLSPTGFAACTLVLSIFSFCDAVRRPRSNWYIVIITKYFSNNIFKSFLISRSPKLESSCHFNSKINWLIDANNMLCYFSFIWNQCLCYYYIVYILLYVFVQIK